MFGEKVVGFREALGMSQKALAERAGLTPSHLNRIEKGTRPPPNVAKVLRIVEVLRLTRAEAEDLLQLAGYSPLVMEAGEGLAYSSPPLSGPIPQELIADLFELHTALAKLPPDRQQRCVDAIAALVDSLGGASGRLPATREEEQHA